MVDGKISVLHLLEYKLLFLGLGGGGGMEYLTRESKSLRNWFSVYLFK